MSQYNSTSGLVGVKVDGSNLWKKDGTESGRTNFSSRAVHYPLLAPPNFAQSNFQGRSFILSQIGYFIIIWATFILQRR